MKKVGYLVLGVVVALSLWGCAKKPASPAPAVQTPAPAVVATASSQPTASAAATIPPGGPTRVDREQLVLSRVPKALKSAKQATAEQGTKLPDLAGATPEIVSYVFVARAGKVDYLFEVYGDGKAYELYEYPKKPNPAKLMGGELPPEEAKILQQPLSPGELAAAAAVMDIMEQSPAARAKVLVYGFNIGFRGKNGKPVMTSGGEPFRLSVDPKGNLVEI